MTFIPEKNIRLTPGREQLVVERNTVIASEPIIGDVISKLRETIITSSTGIVSASTSAVIVGTGTDPNSSAKIITKKRAEYASGFSAEVGIGVIVPTLPTDGQVARWGYFDNDNGIGMGVDSTGSFFFKRIDGVDQNIYQPNWNKDTLDGSGSSGLTLDLSDGIIAEIDFTWYGLGEINYNVRLQNEALQTREERLAHTLLSTGSLSFNVPNQPIRCEVENGPAGGDFHIKLGGRQVTLFGEGKTYERSLSTYVTGVLVDSTIPQPLITLKKKENFGGVNLDTSVQVLVEDFSFISDQPILYEIAYGLSGAISSTDFVSVPRTMESETVVEYQITGSAFSDDKTIVLSSGFVGGGNSSNQRTISFAQDDLTARLVLGDFDFIQVRIAKFAANATVSTSVIWKERW